MTYDFPDWLAPYARVDANGCWLWTKGQATGGYGKTTRGGKTWRAHIWVRTQLVGPVPNGMLVCHHCDVRLCVNPEHNFIGTYVDNMQDASRKGKMTGPPSPLSDEQVREIKRLCGTMRQADVARQYGVTRGTVNHIIKGRNRRRAFEVTGADGR